MLFLPVRQCISFATLLCERISAPLRFGAREPEADVKDQRRTLNAHEEIAATGPGWLGLVLVVVALISALGSFLVLSGLTPVQPTETVTLYALLVNIGFALALVVTMAFQARRLLRARRAGAVICPISRDQSARSSTRTVKPVSSPSPGSTRSRETSCQASGSSSG